MTQAQTRLPKDHAPQPNPNAWVVSNNAGCWLTLNLNAPYAQTASIREGDAVLFYAEKTDITAFARIYRIRRDLEQSTLYFDGLIELETPVDPVSLGIAEPTSAIERIDWPTFEAALQSTCGIAFADFPTLTGQSLQEQNHLRRLLQMATKDDLLGPANGPYEEVVGMSVRDRYLVGKLAPKIPSEDELPPVAGESEIDDEELTGNDDHIPNSKKASYNLAGDEEDEPEKELDASKNQSLVPSSLGFTFCLDGNVEEIELEVRWGRYRRGPSEHAESEATGKPLRAWRRTPAGGKRNLALTNGDITPFAPDAESPEVFVKGIVRPPLPSGDRLVTLFLINDQMKPEQNQDAAWVFQPEIIVRGKDGATVFRRRPVLEADGTDEEREALEMVYRKRVEFAVGHGVSVHAVTATNDPEQASEVRTVVVPEYEVQVTETPGTNPEDRPAMRQLIDEGVFDMERLATMERAELVSALQAFTSDYDAWIQDQRNRIPGELPDYATTAEEALSRCEAVLARLNDGIQTLESSDDALEAFRFANRAMALQRIRSIYALQRRRGKTLTVASLDERKNRSWRPFQLAFVLLSIPALADPLHADRTDPIEANADLLWFPTGGGKTEAYLGVAAFTMAIRRLQNGIGNLDSSRGLAVIMRYTLRLLTIQQFQRATTLLCAMETLRKADTTKWGQHAFSLGLWVGNRVTPGSTERSHQIIENERDGKRGGSETPAQLTFCPWCGTEILPGRDVHVDRDQNRTSICCGDKLSQCDFSRAKSGGIGLPVVVVDEEIYRRPPSMLIGTVDKFAMMAWRGETRTLFGKAREECDRHGLVWPACDCNGNHNKKGPLPSTKGKAISPLRPPDLIIQDEFHLISGPLGTMVGLYETAVDELSSWEVDGKTIRPKVIASTATVRKAREQVNNVFLRRVAVFPPHGVDIEDNFFSVQRSIEEKPGRLYMGICSPGSSRPAVLIRLYVALLTGAQALFERFGQAADPYMTLVGYFNSLRELGGMRRLAEDDVQTRAYRVQMSRVNRPGLNQRRVRNIEELTSRVSSKQIPIKLDQLEVQHKASWAQGETQSIDVVLATNMLSVGVDVNRLGLMAVNGQPKSTAEYIQATSRVGRSFPGLVCTVLTWSRPRDLSHYESYEHYHATFYKHVEAQSVTPFAPRAMDRGLSGTFLSLLRLEDEDLNPNLGAMALVSSAHPEALRERGRISNRAWKVTDRTQVRDRADGMLADLIDQWVREATRGGRRLGYETESRQGDVVALLKKPGTHAWDKFTIPMSMREVEPGVGLIMDTAKFAQDSEPGWRAPTPAQEEDSNA